MSGDAAEQKCQATLAWALTGHPDTGSPGPEEIIFRSVEVCLSSLMVHCFPRSPQEGRGQGIQLIQGDTGVLGEQAYNSSPFNHEQAWSPHHKDTQDHLCCSWSKVES